MGHFTDPLRQKAHSMPNDYGQRFLIQIPYVSQPAFIQSVTRPL